MSKIIGGYIQQDKDKLFGFVRIDGQDDVIRVSGALPSQGACVLEGDNGKVTVNLQRVNNRPSPKAPWAKGTAQYGRTKTNIVAFLTTNANSGATALGLSVDKPFKPGRVTDISL